MAYHRTHGVNTKIVRIFNTFGPRMRLQDGRAIPAFFTQALKKEAVTIFGDGQQTRSLCYVTDLVDGIDRLIHSDLNEPINLGNPNELSMLELAKKIIKLSGSDSLIEFRSLPEDDPKVRRPDISLAKRHLAWQPQIDLDDGLRKTIDYFRSRLAEDSIS